jgi:hypothetical protein
MKWGGKTMRWVIVSLTIIAVAIGLFCYNYLTIFVIQPIGAIPKRGRGRCLAEDQHELHR